MTYIIAILNQKGGVGKTTISANLGVTLKKAGFSVLMVDTDPQGSLRDWGAAKEEGQLSVVGLDRETLSKDIQAIKDPFDFVIIDGRAKAEKMASITIKATDLVLIPVAPSALDVWGAADLVESIQTRHEVSEGKPLVRFIINNAREGTKLIKEVIPAVEKQGFKTLKTVLYNREIYKQTIGEGETVHASNNKLAIAEMESLKNEIIEVLHNEI